MPREGEIDIMTSRFGGRATSFAVRVAPLGPAVGDGGLILVLAEDQTESRRGGRGATRLPVANISHELKTPVGALARCWPETVEEAADDPDAVLRFAGRMRQEAARLTDLVQDLIMLSRIQAAEPVPDPRPVLLDSVVAEALDECWSCGHDRARSKYGQRFGDDQSSTGRGSALPARRAGSSSRGRSLDQIGEPGRLLPHPVGEPPAPRRGRRRLPRPSRPAAPARRPAS